VFAMSKLFHKGDSKSDAIFDSWSYSKNNYILFGIGIIFLIIGYVIMGLGETNSFQSLSLAPVILAIGYLVLIPYALIYKKKEKIKGS
tara:strand:- start:37 stop:300 length:264 start_codon:yes stop_codon:yes gene_type:complete